MASAVFCPYMPSMGGAAVSGFPTTRGLWKTEGLLALSRQALPTDPVGAFTLTLEGLVIGSAIQVQAVDGTPLHNETAAATTEVIVLQAYAAGSPLNDLRVKVRKGSSAPFYQPFVTQTLAVKGAQTIFVSQIPDE